jgi:hypothetical protein
MATSKRPDFGGFTKRTVKKPSSMGDFLKNDTAAEEDTPKPEQPPVATKAVSALKSDAQQQNSDSAPSIEASQGHSTQGQGDDASDGYDEKSKKPVLHLTDATTLNFDPDIMDDLEMLWITLRRNAPAGKKKKISKSLLINLMIAKSVKEMNEDLTGHPIVKTIHDFIR